MDRWVCQRLTNNEEAGYMRREILAKSESWIPLPEAERSDYKCEYKTANGWFTGEELSEQLKAA